MVVLAQINQKAQNGACFSKEKNEVSQRAALSDKHFVWIWLMLNSEIIINRKLKINN